MGNFGPKLKEEARQTFDELIKLKPGSRDDKIYGCVLGQLIGDAIGSFLEFKKTINQTNVELALKMPGGGHFYLAPGQITDDGELAIELLRGLQGRDFDQEAIASRYDAWYCSKPFDIGKTIKSALKRDPNLNIQSIAQYQMENAVKYNQERVTNGSLMRISPLGIYCAIRNLKWEEIKIIAQQEIKLTHSNVETQEIGQLWVYLLSQLINMDGEKQLEIQRVLRQCDEAVKDLSESVQYYYIDDIEPKFRENIGDAKKSFTYGFQTLRNYNPKINFRSFMEEIMLKGYQQMRLSGDTDTNGCILGAMMGSILGFHTIYKEIPEQVCTILNCSPKRDRMNYKPIFALQLTSQLIRNLSS